MLQRFQSFLIAAGAERLFSTFFICIPAPILQGKAYSYRIS